MHGVLMSAVRDSSLHEQSGSKPFTQHLLRVGEGRYVWTINMLEPNACQPIKNWLHDCPESFYVGHYNVSLGVSAVARTSVISYADLLDQCLVEHLPSRLRVEFVTPVCFKRAGTINPLPSPRLLVQSALRKWNEFSDGPVFHEAEVLDEIERQVTIREFELRNQHIAVDKANLTGALGFMTLQSARDPDVVRILNLALRYGEYASFGAKTAMGLGAASVRSVESRSEKRTRQSVNSVPELVLLP